MFVDSMASAIGFAKSAAFNMMSEAPSANEPKNNIPKTVLTRCFKIDMCVFYQIYRNVTVPLSNLSCKMSSPREVK